MKKTIEVKEHLVLPLVNTVRHLNFTSEANKLLNKELYISATRLVKGTREFILAQDYPPRYSKETQAYFALGIQKHLTYQKDIKTLEEYGYLNYRRDLYQHKEITLKELKVLSLKHKIYGIIDVFKISYDTQNNIYIHIDELKSSWNKKNILQLVFYVLALTDDTTKLIYEVPFKRKKNKDGTPMKKRIMGYLFPNPEKINSININGRVVILEEEDINYEEIVKNGMFTEQSSLWLMVIMKRLKYYRQLIRRKRVDLSAIPHEKNRSCCRGGWGYICQKVNYKPNSKQFFISRNKIKLLKENILIQTKPKVI